MTFRPTLPLAFAALTMAAIATDAGVAAADTVQCDGCPPSTMEQAAIGRATLTGHYTEPVYVIDVIGNLAMKFTITRERDWETRTYYVSAEAVPVEASVVNLTSVAHAYAAAAAALPSLPDQPGMPGSVYEHMTQPGLDPQVNAFIDLSLGGMAQRLHDTVSLFNPLEWFKPDAVVVKVRLHYADGSTAIFTFNKQTGQWERTKGTERDSHGNLVPLSPNDFTSEGGGERIFDFSGGSDDDWVNFLMTAEMLGIPITGSVSHRRIGCVRVGDGPVQCSGR